MTEPIPILRPRREKIRLYLVPGGQILTALDTQPPPPGALEIRVGLETRPVLTPRILTGPVPPARQTLIVPYFFVTDPNDPESLMPEKPSH